MQPGRWRKKSTLSKSRKHRSNRAAAHLRARSHTPFGMPAPPCMRCALCAAPRAVALRQCAVALCQRPLRCCTETVCRTAPCAAPCAVAPHHALPHCGNARAAFNGPATRGQQPQRRCCLWKQLADSKARQIRKRNPEGVTVSPYTLLGWSPWGWHWYQHWRCAS